MASVCNIIHMMSIILSIIGGLYWHCQHSIMGQIVYINAYYGHHVSAQCNTVFRRHRWLSTTLLSPCPNQFIVYHT